MDSKIKEKLNQVNNKKLYVGFTEAVKDATESAIEHFFPGYFGNSQNIEDSFKKALGYVLDDENKINEIYEQFSMRFEDIFEIIVSDIDAAYRGDPATKNIDEIILTYPAFRAISAYRFAHELYVLGVPILPRAITEYEHRLTGIDIHPGATIGKSFFIDHGTGVVIGGTTIIGDNVTLYQNVTLGAKSFPHDDEGKLIKGIKRHPNIGDNVVIYAGATILGNISIEDGEVISGNSWVV